MYKQHDMTALIAVRPDEARAAVRSAYREAKASVKDAATILKCSERTLHTWIARLEMDDELRRLKAEALANGWHHDKGHMSPGRPRSAKKNRRRPASRAG